MQAPRARSAAKSLRSAQVPRALRAESATERFRERVYGWIRRIPRGKVATYGQIAVLAGYPRQARRVGQALGGPHMPPDVPWQRVINSQGRVSDRSPRIDRAIGARESEQEERLKREGVKFVRGKTDLDRFRWRPKGG
jgi:methylated-DNA-protein-cysteine methyltransferase-like protein